MAYIFVRGSSGSNGNSGADWPNAKQTITNALSIAMNNDVILVDYAQTFTANAAITWIPPAGNVAILSVEPSGTSGFIRTNRWGAGESVGAAAAAFSITGVQGSTLYVYGLWFYSGTTNSASSIINLLITTSVFGSAVFERCTFQLQSAGLTSVVCGPTASTAARSPYIKMINCSVQATGSRAGILITPGNVVLDMVSCSVVLSGISKPSSLFAPIALNDHAQVTIQDCDFSAAATTTTIVNLTNFARSTFLFKDSRFATATLLSAGFAAGSVGSITTRNCLYGSNLTRFEYINYQLSQSTTGVYLDSSNGANFADNPVSWIIVVYGADTTEFNPVYSDTLEVWNDVIGMRLASIEVSSDLALTDREVWVEASYNYDNSLITNRNTMPFFGTAVVHPTSDATWSYSPVSKQKLLLSFNATVKGLLQARIGFSKDLNLYVNPVITLS